MRRGWPGRTGPPLRGSPAALPARRSGTGRLAAAGLIAVLVSGCGSPGSTGAAPESEVAVPAGMEDCTAFAGDGSTLGGAEGLPALRLPCLAGGADVDLQNLGGRPVLINLWASWCAPCREEMPMLQAAYERFGEAVGFLGVNTEDTRPAALSLLADLGVTYAHVVDRDQNLMTELAAPGLPVTLAVDADGRIADRQIGQLSAARLEEMLAGLSAASSPGS